MKKEIITRQEIENIRVGDIVKDCKGNKTEVSSIFALGEDGFGKKYICYYAKYLSAEISTSLKEGWERDTI